MDEYTFTLKGNGVPPSAEFFQLARKLGVSSAELRTKRGTYDEIFPVYPVQDFPHPIGPGLFVLSNGKKLEGDLHGARDAEAGLKK